MSKILYFLKFLKNKFFAKSKQKNVGLDVDPGNGFGAKYLVRSNIIKSQASQVFLGAKVLDQVQFLYVYIYCLKEAR